MPSLVEMRKAKKGHKMQKKCRKIPRYTLFIFRISRISEQVYSQPNSIYNDLK